MSRAAGGLLVIVVLAGGIAAAWLLGTRETGDAAPAPAPPHALSPQPQGNPPPAAPAPGQAPSASAQAGPIAAAEGQRTHSRARTEADLDYDRCMALALADPERGVAEASRWRSEGGGDAAAHCEATARLRAGDGARAATLLEELGRTAFAPDEARASLLAQASQILLEIGDYPRAYGAITQALVLRPTDPDLLTDRAVIAASAGRFEEAIDDLTRVIDLRADRAEAYVLRASAWRQIGQAGLARDDIARALAREPLNQEAWLESGFLRHAANDAAGARRDWEQTARIAPDTATAALALRNLALLSISPETLSRPAEAAGASSAPLPRLPLPPPSPPRR